MSAKSPVDLLADVGRALYGEHWRIALARAIGVDDDTVRRWMTGRTAFGFNHPVWARAIALVAQRRREIERVDRAISQTNGLRRPPETQKAAHPKASGGTRSAR